LSFILEQQQLGKIKNTIHTDHLNNNICLQVINKIQIRTWAYANVSIDLNALKTLMTQYSGTNQMFNNNIEKLNNHKIEFGGS